MSKLSQGLKAGLAAGVVYGALIGVQHFVLLEGCRDTQILFITQQLTNQNESASDLFATDLIYFPINWGIRAMIMGVIYGAAFSFIYEYLPGHNSRQKGIFLGFPVFVIGIFFYLSGLEVSCRPELISVFGMAVSLPISLAFGYILGMFFDSFASLEIEDKEESKRRANNEKSNPLKEPRVE